MRNKNTLRTNKLVILKINKNTQPQPKITGSYERNRVYMGYAISTFGKVEVTLFLTIN